MLTVMFPIFWSHSWFLIMLFTIFTGWVIKQEPPWCLPMSRLLLQQLYCSGSPPFKLLIRLVIRDCQDVFLSCIWPNLVAFWVWVNPAEQRAQFDNSECLNQLPLLQCVFCSNTQAVYQVTNRERIKSSTLYYDQSAHWSTYHFTART